MYSDPLLCDETICHLHVIVDSTLFSRKVCLNSNTMEDDSGLYSHINLRKLKERILGIT